MPSPRSIDGPNNSSIRPVPVPRSSSDWNGLPASACDNRLLHRLIGGMQLAEAVPFRRMGAEIILRRLGARVAHSGQPFAIAATTGSVGSSRSTSRRAMPALSPRSAIRKNAQAPSRWRSIRPASESSLRWREMRGCDWRRISVRSETVSSVSASSARMRRRVPSATARNASCMVSNAKSDWTGHCSSLRGRHPRYKDIFIR